MYNNLISQDYLMHYGVKGMKWGVRHDPERTGRNSSNQSNKSKKSKKMSPRTKVLLGAAVVAGSLALGVAGRKGIIAYGKLYADNIIEAGATLRRVTQNPEGVAKGDMGFFADNQFDSDQYKAHVGRPMNMFGMPVGPNKQSVEAKVKKNIRVAGLRTGKKEFKNLYDTDKEFKDIIDNGYGRGVDDSLDNKWRMFNTYGLLRKNGTYSKETQTFINRLKSKGYDGIADINDRKYSGFDTRAHVLFNYKDKIGDVKITNMSDSDISAAKKRFERRLKLENTVGSPEYYAGVSAVILPQ